MKTRRERDNANVLVRDPWEPVLDRVNRRELLGIFLHVLPAESEFLWMAHLSLLKEMIDRFGFRVAIWYLYVSFRTSYLSRDVLFFPSFLLFFFSSFLLLPFFLLFIFLFFQHEKSFLNPSPSHLTIQFMSAHPRSNLLPSCSIIQHLFRKAVNNFPSTDNRYGRPKKKVVIRRLLLQNFASISDGYRALDSVLGVLIPWHLLMLRAALSGKVKPLSFDVVTQASATLVMTLNNGSLPFLTNINKLKCFGGYVHTAKKKKTNVVCLGVL